MRVSDDESAARARRTSAKALPHQGKVRAEGGPCGILITMLLLLGAMLLLLGRRGFQGPGFGFRLSPDFVSQSMYGPEGAIGALSQFNGASSSLSSVEPIIPFTHCSQCAPCFSIGVLHFRQGKVSAIGAALALELELPLLPLGAGGVRAVRGSRQHKSHRPSLRKPRCPKHSPVSHIVHRKIAGFGFKPQAPHQPTMNW